MINSIRMDFDFAVIDSDNDAINAFLAKGFSPDDITDQLPVLHFAISCRNLRAVEILLDHGANVSLLDAVGNDALMISAAHEELEIFKAILSKYENVNAQNSDGQSALMIACKFNFIEAVMLLIAKGANINQIDSSGNTALHSALMLSDNDQIVEILIASNADASLNNFGGFTSISYATKLAREKSLRLLQKFGE
jgi:uncharacterized protein